jgi:hypothetical protein
MNNAENAPNGMRFRAIKVPRGQSRMLKTCIASLLSVVMLGGCSKLIPKFDEVLPDKRTQYKKSKTLPDLEIPPDLSVDAIQDIMAIPTIGEGYSACYSPTKNALQNANGMWNWNARNLAQSSYSRMNTSSQWRALPRKFGLD